MITRKLPITGGAYKNVDEVSLTRNSPVLIDGYPNEAGSTVKRPGLPLWKDLGISSPMDGLYWWDKEKCLILVCAKRVYRINSTETRDAFDITGTELEQAGIVNFDDSGSSLYMAYGKRIAAYDNAARLSSPEMTGSGADDLVLSGNPTAAGSFKLEIDGADSFSEAVIERTATNPADGSTLTIGTVTYRFKNALAAAYDVTIGSTASDTMDNLILAINALGTPGTTYYAGTIAHPLFIAGVQDTNLKRFTLSAILKGTSNNGIVISTTSAQYTVPATTSGGVDNTFKWSNDGGVTWNATGVSITTVAQPLLAGVYAQFSSKVGHELGDYWTFYATQKTTYLLSNRNAPDSVSHVSVHDTYLLCNELGTGRFHYSKVGNPPVFQAINYASAESNPDDIVALFVRWREITIFGKKSIEPWYDDGVTPFSRLEGAYAERGCGAPQSIQFVDNTWIWLDNGRRFSKMQGRTPMVISTPYDKVLQSLSRIDDAYSMTVEANGRTWYVCTFPSDKLTLAYDWAANEWAQWGWWNMGTVEHEHFIGRCHAYSPDWGLHFIGDRNTGKVYAIDASSHTDDGNPIRTIRRTGHVDHGTSRKKMCKGIRVKLLRSAGDENGSEPKLVVRWRDDNGLWGQDHEISLGKQGDTEFYGQLGFFRSLGVYRSRQWEFVHSDDSSFVLVDVEEDIEVLTV